MSARIASSCSAWMVATMSRMPPGAVRSSAASSAPSPTTGEPRSAGGVGVEDLVVEADEARGRRVMEVPAADDAHRLDRRRPVEGLGDRRAPVDDQRRVVVVGHRDPTDVEGVVGRSRSCRSRRPKHERRVADVELGQAAAGVGLGGVPLEAGLVGAAPRDVGVALRDPLGRPAHRRRDGRRRRRCDAAPPPAPGRFRGRTRSPPRPPQGRSTDESPASGN